MLLDRRSVKAQITNTYLPVLALVQARFGGSIYQRRRPVGSTSRQLYDWVVRGPAAVAFLSHLRHHMIEKGVQVDLALAARFYGVNTAMFRALNEKLKARKRVDHGL